METKKDRLIKNHDLLVKLHNRTADEKKAAKLRKCIKQIKFEIKNIY